MSINKTLDSKKSTDNIDQEFWDFDSPYEYDSKHCKITCGDEVRYSNIVDCAKEIGNEIASSRTELPTDNACDIVVTYLDKVIAIRKYIGKKYNDDEYKAFLGVVDPYRPSDDIPKPIILKFGYYTDWIQIY